jgi:hypothetical protein
LRVWVSSSTGPQPDDRHFLERMLNRLVLTFLTIGTGVVSVLLFSVRDDTGLEFLGDVGLLEVLGWIGLFIGVTLLLRVLLAVLRSEAEARRR